MTWTLDYRTESAYNVETPLPYEIAMKEKNTETRRKIVERVDDFNYITGCCSLGEIQSLVNNLSAIYGANATIEFDYDDYNGFTECIRFIREETDEEMNARLEQQLKKKADKLAAKKNKLKQERKEYERLRRKFEKDES